MFTLGRGIRNVANQVGNGHDLIGSRVYRVMGPRLGEQPIACSPK